jgi:hypothetical protein
MCSRLSEDHGYICDECFKELVGLKMEPAEFMATEWRTTKPFGRTEAMYDKEFPLQGNW